MGWANCSNLNFVKYILSHFGVVATVVAPRYTVMLMVSCYSTVCVLLATTCQEMEQSTIKTQIRGKNDRCKNFRFHIPSKSLLQMYE